MSSSGRFTCIVKSCPQSLLSPLISHFLVYTAPSFPSFLSGNVQRSGSFRRFLFLPANGEGIVDCSLSLKGCAAGREYPYLSGG